MLGIRLDAETEKSLAAIARRTRRSKSDIAREALVKHVRTLDQAYLGEARRQSLQAAERDDPGILDLLDSALADLHDRYLES